MKKTWERQKIWIPRENGWDYRLETEYEADVRARMQLQWYQHAVNFYKARVRKEHDVQQQPVQARQAQEPMLQQHQMQGPQQQMHMQMQKMQMMQMHMQMQQMHMQMQMQIRELAKWKRLASAAAALAIAKPTEKYLEERIPKAYNFCIQERKAVEKDTLKQQKQRQQPLPAVAGFALGFPSQETHATAEERIALELALAESPYEL